MANHYNTTTTLTPLFKTDKILANPALLCPHPPAEWLQNKVLFLVLSILYELKQPQNLLYQYVYTAARSESHNPGGQTHASGAPARTLKIGG